MPANGNAAPVCPISRSQAAPGMPAARTPAIPTATDLPSLIAAVNTINLIIQSLLGPGTVTNNVFPPNMPIGGGSSPTTHGGGGTVSRPPSWGQGKDDVEQMHIYHKDFSATNITEDKSQWIAVARIDTVTFSDANSNDTFLWQYHLP